MKSKINLIYNILSSSKNSKKKIKSIINEDYVLNYLEKYSYVLEDNTYDDNKSEYKNKVWQLWFQGIEKAPPIVRKCIDSVEKYIDNRDIIILDEKNIHHYIEIDPIIYDKKRKGYISNVNFSDILRAYLLANHGGTWIDSTVFLTGKIDKLLSDNNLFCYSTTPYELLGYSNILASSWFIHSNEENKIFKAIKKIIREFWLYENNCLHHYYFHLIFLLAINKNENCRNEWNSVPFYSNVPPHILQMELFNKYNKKRFDQILEMSPVHKLTYYGGSEFKPDLKGTYFDYIVNKYL